MRQRLTPGSFDADHRGLFGDVWLGGTVMAVACIVLSMVADHHVDVLAVTGLVIAPLALWLFAYVVTVADIRFGLMSDRALDD